MDNNKPLNECWLHEFLGLRVSCLFSGFWNVRRSIKSDSRTVVHVYCYGTSVQHGNYLLHSIFSSQYLASLYQYQGGESLVGTLLGLPACSSLFHASCAVHTADILFSALTTPAKHVFLLYRSCSTMHRTQCT